MSVIFVLQKWKMENKRKLDKEPFGRFPTVTLIAEERIDAGLF